MASELMKNQRVTVLQERGTQAEAIVLDTLESGKRVIILVEGRIQIVDREDIQS
jgi:hypothetical protein